MKKLSVFGAVTLLAASLALPAKADDAAVSPAAADTRTLSVSYSGSVLIFQVADINLTSEFSSDTYQASARFTTAGLAALFSDADIEAGVTGYRDGPQLRPFRYSHLNHASNKNRIVAIDFPDGVATPNINPPFGNMGEPPASETERRGAADPLSTLLALSVGAVAQGESVCRGQLPVFDGRARYNLRFVDGGREAVRTRAWSGDARVCHAYYEPVSGYEVDEFPTPEDIARPITFWLAPMDNGSIHVPVRIHTNAGFGGATVVARSIELN
ncbi:DUF3108 domain-containing protein [Maricaulis sp. CAU 1757]